MPIYCPFNDTVLMCEPRYFEVRDVKNPFMQGAVVDRARAQTQWQALLRTIRDAGVGVERIDPVSDLEDMVFTANQAFLGRTPVGRRFAIMSRMVYPSRQREVEYFRAWLRARDFEEITVDLRGGHLEGHGDLLWHPGRPTIWAGYGHRSSRLAVEGVGAAMAEHGIAVQPLELIDPRFYHLDTCFSPLNEQAALIFPDAFAPDALAALRKAWPRLYEVTLDEALRFVCNGIVAKQTLITSYFPDRLYSAIADEGLRSLTVDLSEFEKSGGSAFCMKTFVS